MALPQTTERRLVEGANGQMIEQTRVFTPGVGYSDWTEYKPAGKSSLILPIAVLGAGSLWYISKSRNKGSAALKTGLIIGAGLLALSYAGFSNVGNR